MLKKAKKSRSVSPFLLDVLRDPPCSTSGPSFGSHPCHMSEAGLCPPRSRPLPWHRNPHPAGLSPAASLPLTPTSAAARCFPGPPTTSSRTVGRCCRVWEDGVASPDLVQLDIAGDNDDTAARTPGTDSPRSGILLSTHVREWLDRCLVSDSPNVSSLELRGMHVLMLVEQSRNHGIWGATQAIIEDEFQAQVKNIPCAPR